MRKIIHFFQKKRMLSFFCSMVMLGVAVLAVAVSVQAAHPLDNLGAPFPGTSYMGPGGGGRIYYPAISPLDENLIFVSGDMEARWRSDNGGQSYTLLEIKAGRVFFHPTDVNIIFASCGNTLWRSADKGLRWEMVFPKMQDAVQSQIAGNYSAKTPDKGPDGRPMGMVMDPADPQKAWMFTSARSLYQSTDGGDTWEKMPNSVPGGFTNHPGGSSAAYMETANNVYLTLDPQSPPNARELIATTDGVYRVKTTNGAVETITAAHGWLVADVVVDTHNNKLVFFATRGVASKRAEDRVDPGYNIDRSDDLGKTWTTLSDTFTFSGDSTTIKKAYRYVAAASVDEIYAVWKYDAASGAPANQHGICATQDGGKTWTQALRYRDTSNITNLNPMDLAEDWGFASYGGIGEALCASKAPGVQNICIMTDYLDAYKTVDGGQTWAGTAAAEQADGTWSTTGLNPDCPMGMVFDPHDANHQFYCDTDTGMWESFNGGVSWTRLGSKDGLAPKGFNTGQHIWIDPDFPGHAVGAWTSFHENDEPALDSGKINGVVYRRGYDASGKFVKAADDIRFPRYIAMDPNSPKDVNKRILYLSSWSLITEPGASETQGGIYRSTDSGDTWTRITAGLSDRCKASGDMAFSPDGTKLYATFHDTDPAKIFKVASGLYVLDLTASTLSWTKIALPKSSGKAADFAKDLEVDSHGNIYISRGGEGTITSHNLLGAFVSADGGTSWRTIWPENLSVYAMMVSKTNPNLVVLATVSGVYYSFKGIATTVNDWKRIENFNITKGNSIAQDPTDPNYIYVSTIGAGTVRLHIPEVIPTTSHTPYVTPPVSVTPTASPTPTPTPGKPGDADANGKIDIFDIVAVRNHIFGTELLKDQKFANANVGTPADETLNIFDIVGIRNLIFAG